MNNAEQKTCSITRSGASGYNYVFYSDSLYCDECLHLQNFTNFILSTLHKYGYNTILFFNYNEGVYCKDEVSWQNWARILNQGLVEKKKRKPGNSVNDIRASIRKKGAPTKVETTELEDDCSLEKQVEFIKNIRTQNTHQQIVWLNQLLKVEGEYSVAIVADSELLSKDFGGGVYNDEFDNALANWSTNHSSLALFIWCFNKGSAQAAYSEIMSLGESDRRLSFRSKILKDLQTLGNRASEDNPRPQTIVEVPLPERGEIKNYLNRIRVLGALKFDILQLDALVECLFRVSRERHLKLADIHVQLKQKQGSMITRQELMSLFKVDEIKSGEQQLSELIGMDKIKGIVKEIKGQYSLQTSVPITNISRLERLIDKPKVMRDKLHFLLKGNPGTGKTTVAKILGRTLNEIGVLSSGHVVKCPSSFFSSSHYGETAQKTAEKVEEAMGGVLFIDDIASFIHTHPSSLDEFNGVLLDAMTSYSDICIIVAGYPKAIDEYMKSDQGLARRFSIPISLEDYSDKELAKIFESMAQKDGFAISSELHKLMPIVFKRMYEKLSVSERADWGNAGVAELLYNSIRRTRSSTLSELSIADLPETFNYNNIVFPIKDYICGGTDKNTFNEIPMPAFGSIVKLNNLYLKYNEFDILEEAVLSIKTIKQSCNGEGTGFIITPDGLALTAAHVVSGALDITSRVRTHLKYGGTSDDYYNCSIVAIDHSLDLALIKLEHNIDNPINSLNSLPYITINCMNSSMLKALTEVTMIGYPGGASSNDNISTFQGRIASLQNSEDFGEIYLLDITGISGNSGSPIINSKGEAIGVFLASKTYHGETLTEEINYMRPIKYAKNLFKR